MFSAMDASHLCPHVLSVVSVSTHTLSEEPPTQAASVIVLLSAFQSPIWYKRNDTDADCT